jgi:hypothetical protein
MGDNTNRGIITAIIVIVIIIAAITVWPRTSVAYTYPSSPIIHRVVPTQTVITQPTYVQTTPHTRTTSSTVMTTHTYQYQPPSTTTTYYHENDGGVCTMDAQQCPDGSYVGRTGPSCEFAPCSN